MSSFDEDRELDEWTFFTAISEDIDELLRRVRRKLNMMEVHRRRDLEDRVGPQIARLESNLRQAHTQAGRAAGGRPRRVARTQASRV